MDRRITLLLLGLLTVLTAGLWPAWSAVPEPWHAIGAVTCAVLVAVLAPRWLPARPVALILPLAFTAGWVLVAALTDDSGLWAVGAVLVLLGSAAGAAVLVPAGVALRQVRFAASSAGR